MKKKKLTDPQKAGFVAEILEVLADFTIDQSYYGLGDADTRRLLYQLKANLLAWEQVYRSSTGEAQPRLGGEEAPF